MKKIIHLATFIFIINICIVKANTNTIDSNAVITSIADNGKSVWIGTDKGLWKVCKKSFKMTHFTAENSTLPSNQITCMCVSPDGQVWIGTSNGLVHYDNYCYINVNTENNLLPDNHITAIACDANNDIWIGTHCHGVVKIHNGIYTTYNKANSQLINDCIFSISTDNAGSVWIGFLNDGLVKINNEVWTTYNAITNLAAKNISFVSVSTNNEFNLFTGEGEVYHYDGTSFFKMHEAELKAKIISGFSTEGTNQWICCNDSEIVVVPGNNNQNPLCSSIKSCGEQNFSSLLPVQITNQISCCTKGLTFQETMKAAIVQK